MSYALTGTRYIGTGALPTPIIGYDAVDTSTGNLYASNTSATAWVLIGNVNQANLGMLPLTGGALTGAISGATGLAPIDAPNFTTSAKLLGVDLATQTYVDTVNNTTLTGIAPKITQAIASISAGITVKGSLARANGILVFPSGGSGFPAAQTIPLPIYPDGTVASESDCKWFVSATDGTYGVGFAGNASLLFSPANPLVTRTFSAQIVHSVGQYYNVSIMYWIEAIKS